MKQLYVAAVSLEINVKQLKLFLLVWGLMNSFAFAGTLGEISSASENQTGIFVGLGGSYNFVHLNSNLLGTLNVTGGFPPLGVFDGSRKSFHNRAQDFSLEAQAGYFKHFSGSEWLWGLEFLYQYTNLKIRAPGFVRAIDLADPAASTTDTISFGAIDAKVNDTLMLPAFIGRSYKNSFIYVGIGPSLFNTQQKIVEINDTESAYYIGTMDGISKSKWIWGGAVQAGMAYYVNAAWFFKLNYTCAFTGNYALNKTVSFSPEMNQGFNSGTLSFHSRQSLVSQAVALSINKVFAL
ncbi:MAG: hypothetical protein P4L79_16400 [Legionella sp.]|uniref:hypothetical protein n=1 Tax=Legionella sp. TaxID=459 RepID=UPI00284D9BAD|nr:hypothetical protein [Legionella sp.]